MKLGIRKPSLTKRISARTSPSRFVRHSLEFKAPRGYGWFTNPKRAAYNRVYNLTTFKADGLIIILAFGGFYILWAILKGIFTLFIKGQQTITPTQADITENNDQLCPRCSSDMILRDGRHGKFYGCSQYPRCYGSRDYVIFTTSTPSSPSM